MNINANFKEDFANLIFIEIEGLKKLGFKFDSFDEWKHKYIAKLEKTIEDKKEKRIDYSWEPLKTVINKTNLK